jgi:glucokinase
LKKVEAATFGIAGPVIDQRCVATNIPWVVDARLVARDVGIPRVALLNDLVALAYGALTVPPERIRTIHGDAPPRKTGGNLAVIAAGTGLGEAALIWDGTKHVPLATEGGHCDFAPRTKLEWELFEWLERRFGHVSWERLVAGPGFATLYDFFHDVQRIEDSRENVERLGSAPDRNAAVAELGAQEKSEPARLAVETFARLYGAEAGNLALKTLSTAGVYVAGNIAGRMADTLVRAGFVSAFLDKGRFRALLEQVPVAIVLDSDIGIAGSRFHAAQGVSGVGPSAAVKRPAVPAKKAPPAAKKAVPASPAKKAVRRAKAPKRAMKAKPRSKR